MAARAATPASAGAVAAVVPGIVPLAVKRPICATGRGCVGLTAVVPGIVPLAVRWPIYATGRGCVGLTSKETSPTRSGGTGRQPRSHAKIGARCQAASVGLVRLNLQISLTLNAACLEISLDTLQTAALSNEFILLTLELHCPRELFRRWPHGGRKRGKTRCARSGGACRKRSGPEICGRALGTSSGPGDKWPC